MSVDVTPFRYRQPQTRIFGGDDALAQLAPEVDRAGASRLLVICGRSVATRTNLLERLRAALGERWAGLFDRVIAGSPLPAVEAGVKAARAVDADGIVAVGGGSSVVTARGITILLAESGDPRALATQYRRGHAPVSPRLDAPKVPNFLVLTTPTTAMARAGTALVDPELNHRIELFDPKTRAAAIIWDVEAMLTAPVTLTRSAAVSAYIGLYTGLATLDPNPIADADRRAAVELIREALPALIDDPASGSVRLRLAAAAYLSNRASEVEAGGGAAFGVLAALAHSIDTRYASCGHGDAYAITAPAALRFNLEATTSEQARLARAVGAGDAFEQSAADALEAFLAAVGMPSRLREVGVPEEDLPLIAADAMTDFNLHRNARPVSRAEELLPLLASIY